MRATKTSLTLLSAALAVCVALFLALRFVGRTPAESAGESGYYFTNYASPEALVAVSVENAGGEIVLARTGDTYRVLSDAPAQGDEEEIADFFAWLCRLPLRSLVEDASASDGQYGLTEFFRLSGQAVRSGFLGNLADFQAAEGAEALGVFVAGLLIEWFF